MYPLSSSVWINSLVDSGCLFAESKLPHSSDCSGKYVSPVSKPQVNPSMRYFTKSLSGCLVSSFSSWVTLTGLIFGNSRSLVSSFLIHCWKCMLGMLLLARQTDM